MRMSPRTSSRGLPTGASDPKRQYLGSTGRSSAAYSDFSKDFSKCLELSSQDVQFPAVRVERLVAVIRFAFVSYIIVALGLAPPLVRPGTQPFLDASLAAYVILSAGTLAVVWRAVKPTPLAWIAHAFDLVEFFLVFYLTRGTIELVLPFFVLLLIVGTLRWRTAGIVATVLAVAVALDGMALHDGLGTPGSIRAHEFAMKVAALAIMAVLVIALGVFGDRARQVPRHLGTGPKGVYEDREALGRRLADWVARAMGAPRALVAWEDPNEPWLCLGFHDDGTSQYLRKPPDLIDSLVADALDGTNFICRKVLEDPAEVLHSSPDGLKRWQGIPLHPRLRELTSPRSVLSATFDTEVVRGRIFLFDAASMTSDDLAIGEVLARQVGWHLSLFYLIRDLGQRAAVAERMRVGRDLHDGVLHALSGVALELENLLRRPDVRLSETQDYIRQIQDGLATEQRALRRVINELRNSAWNASEAGLNLPIRLKELVARVERHRGLEVTWSFTNLDEVPDGLADEVCLLVDELLENAVRHSRATTIKLDTTLADCRVRILVVDNGRGFPFHGRRDLATLTARSIGPATIKERVRSLSGALTIDSSPNGSRIEISLPVVSSPA